MRDSGTIRQELERLETEYREAVRAELAGGLSATQLLSIASSNDSNWSGGHSAANLCEQANRTAAIRQLEKNFGR
jgi:hypothetical protein